MLNALDISTSGLVAQRQRLNAITSNIANLSTVVNEDGEVKAYQPKYVVFQTDEDAAYPTGSAGVKVASVEQEAVDPLYKYQPNHPLAIQEGRWAGYVPYPNINLQREMVDALEATRAYEANIGVIEATNAMGEQTLRILV
ncbi:MAG: flagellar basal body rod protein FlgC [Planctomycetota bacterium]|nr:MAG: flagellar basal body rod protein FlgC [Planctomycetota bacterium]REJ94391.1 MAG: flagellar basal body rod protein FlgC [Planctomycetota bacterium]REK22076.1 MAG: flagellar basal body rod protein FlgC [Planctomycetota bacterium]REK44484.1 MAG: flagellar basal body rod protein FlgC [Planctomycetota bacterium]